MLSSIVKGLDFHTHLQPHVGLVWNWIPILVTSHGIWWANSRLNNFSNHHTCIYKISQKNGFRSKHFEIYHFNRCPVFEHVIKPNLKSISIWGLLREPYYLQHRGIPKWNGMKFRENDIRLTYNLLAEASSFVAWTAALLLRESPMDFSIFFSCPRFVAVVEKKQKFLVVCTIRFLQIDAIYNYIVI